MEKKEAMKILKDFYDKSALFSIRTALDTVIPELRSDDEKIRKAIHIYLDWLDGRKDYAPKGNYTIRDMIAWLEKQEPNTHKREVDDAYLQGMCDAKHEIEKHGDTNANSSEWSEEDEQMILSIEQVMNCASLLNIVPEKIDNIKSWLKSLRPKKQQKPIEKQDEQQGKSALEVWKDMRLEVYQQASGNRHEPNYSDDTTKMFSLNDIDEIIEKISEHPTADKIEPKFNVGNWVILPLGIIAHIDSLNSTDYQVTTTDGKICDFKISKQDNYHLWSISDARDGDVLVGKDGRPFIFTGKFDIQDDNPIAHCGINSSNKFRIGCSTHWTFKDGVKPATKEQRDLLFEKMENAGYMWDSEKKELKKIEPKTLNADEVIKWLTANVHLYASLNSLCGSNCPQGDVEVESLIKSFKKDFGL